ncbi:MAG: glycosyltransferase family 2 protein [Candidatus Omnitrophica bacterium]|nr:glycosyltransferase family 2 protein [Candidatus Omnitrophota bacterium]
MTEERAPSVSVIMPTFRRPELLNMAVTSVLAQTFTDFELCVIDDDPEASARLAMEKFHDRRISYSLNRGEGAAAARNTGLARARGQFIAFLDDDDVWKPDFLEKMTQALKVLPARVGVLHCAVEHVLDNDKSVINYPRHKDDVFTAMLRGEKSSGIIALVRREVFDACGNFDERLLSAQDWELWIRVSKKFHFNYIPDVLAVIRAQGDRISKDPGRAISSRELILQKYSSDFKRYPEARVILLKRLGKLNAQLGQWKKAWHWFKQAAENNPAEWLKIVGWLVIEQPLLSSSGRYAWGAVGLAVAVAGYSQFYALKSMYVMNDDVCQHIWWMEVFRNPALFSHDLLLSYALTIEHLGMLLLYKAASFVMAPLTLTKVLPFLLFPASAWAIFRIAFTWTKSPYTSFLVSIAFMVTPIYIQHMTGGQAHVFGYPLFLFFLYFLSAEKYRSALLALLVSVFFFPVIFVLGVGLWGAGCTKLENRKILLKGSREFLAAVLIGLVILAFKFLALSSVVLGEPFSRAQVMGMPELTSSGRWQVWPVDPMLRIMVHFAEQGVFIFKAVQKSAFPLSVKHALLNMHILWCVFFLGALAWWWRVRKNVLDGAKWLMAVLVVSGVFYVIAGQFLLKFYAPDRYVSYSVTIAALLFLVIPLGMFVSQWPEPGVQRVLKVVAAVLFLSAVPLVRNAGLTDYSTHKKLYAFLRTLPANVLIAAYPETADGIPTFSKRSVFINEELSVPLYDRYWQTIKLRTFDFFSAYYAGDPRVVNSFVRRNGITHLVIERKHFSKDFLEGRIYFEPFGSWVKGWLKPGQKFYLENIPLKNCVFQDQDVCVLEVKR